MAEAYFGCPAEKYEAPVGLAVHTMSDHMAGEAVGLEEDRQSKVEEEEEEYDEDSELQKNNCVAQPNRDVEEKPHQVLLKVEVEVADPAVKWLVGVEEDEDRPNQEVELKGQILPEEVETAAPAENALQGVVADKEALVFEVLAQMAQHNSLDHTLQKRF